MKWLRYVQMLQSNLSTQKFQNMRTLLKTTAITLLLIGSFAFTITSQESTSRSTITVKNFSKKWKLEQYSYYGYGEKPSSKDKNDYIHFKSNMTFTSVSEGKLESGKWRLDTAKKRVYLSEKGKQGEWELIISTLSSTQLVFSINDPSDSDSKNLKFHYKL